MNVVASLIFTPKGMIRGTYSEVIDLACLGRLKISRATRIEFDNVKQSWRVKDMKGQPLFTAPSRQECLDWERRYLERKEDMKHARHQSIGAAA
jgi:hypothetical protein